ncbi:MAG: hypothetical protein ACD_38C00051G0001 [uncultured bacterium]|uniref:Inositol-1-monophosphatase n=1 Tax=Candidatus Daviesbacteria bacterium RIFCSPHIGHO2_01_FULL_40_11 TaxID=1797762 RepID=A0A1F5JGB4_9BACT|nr:MAG: hypothetical protein ACD_38C00051G0001 [uncultured bacterium]OGE27681.1 MAG: hypothetical protein A2867_03955 [Candidatus Daviesbacteria bacterium RIFCSPHIGHO2_01_FULL_40_11]
MEDNFLKVAKQAAIEAGKVIRKCSGEDLDLSLKNEDKSNFVTKADLEAEETIVKILTKNFPTHNIIAEENTKIDKGSKYTWVVDPIDGTITFVHGIPYFSVSIGLLENNKPILGAIYIIGFKQMFWATRGRGAYLNGKKINVSTQNVLGAAVCTLDFGHKKRRPEKMEAYINLLINKIAYPYSFGSGVATQALVGRGMLDAFVCQAWLWDFVAGAVIVREAGGKVTDFEGNEPDWTKGRLEIVASNGLVHDEILEAIRR